MSSLASAVWRQYIQMLRSLLHTLGARGEILEGDLHVCMFYEDAFMCMGIYKEEEVYR